MMAEDPARYCSRSDSKPIWCVRPPEETPFIVGEEPAILIDPEGNNHLIHSADELKVWIMERFEDAEDEE
jgi:hypothetical protein